MEKDKAIRERIKPRLYDATYLLTKRNIETFDRLLNLLDINMPLKVLDLGCGYKPFKTLLAEKGFKFEYIGIDFSDKDAEPDIVLDLNKDKLPFEDETFDLVILSEVLEHLYNPWHVLAEVNRVTKCGGYIFISTPFVFHEHVIPYDYYRYTSLFYNRWAQENNMELIFLRKAGSFLSMPFFTANLLLLAGFSFIFKNWKIRDVLMSPIVIFFNVLGILCDYLYESLFPSKNPFYCSTSLILRKNYQGIL